MDQTTTLSADTVVALLAALAQTRRLEVFRLLLRHEPAGLAAGDIARALGVPHNTLSTHLGILAQVGLVHGKRVGRQVIYRVDIARLRALTGFLVNDCCGGDPAACAPLADQLIFA